MGVTKRTLGGSKGYLQQQVCKCSVATGEASSVARIQAGWQLEAAPGRQAKLLPCVPAAPGGDVDC